jgi:NCAIR mutase (PurE)-related protein
MPVSVVSAQTQLKTSAGRVKKVHVQVAGAAGTINDVAAAGVGNPILAVPATLGFTMDFGTDPIPFANGICVNPGAGQTVVVFWD